MTVCNYKLRGKRSVRRRSDEPGFPKFLETPFLLTSTDVLECTSIQTNDGLALSVTICNEEKDYAARLQQTDEPGFPKFLETSL